MRSERVFLVLFFLLSRHVCRDNLLVNVSIERGRIEMKLSELSKLQKI